MPLWLQSKALYPKWDFIVSVFRSVTSDKQKLLLCYLSWKWLGPWFRKERCLFDMPFYVVCLWPLSCKISCIYSCARSRCYFVKVRNKWVPAAAGEEPHFPEVSSRAPGIQGSACQCALSFRQLSVLPLQHTVAFVKCSLPWSCRRE